jgi:tetratricopeptide (TPR) repeat protein
MTDNSGLHTSGKWWIDLWNKGPIAICSAMLYAILFVFDAISKLQIGFRKYLSLNIPPNCIIIGVTGLILLLALSEQLFRRKLSIDGTKLIHALSTNSRIRKIIWLVLIILLAVIIGLEKYQYDDYFTMHRNRDSICIFIDSFEGPGWENIDWKQRLKDALVSELDKILPGTSIEFPAAPEILTSQKDRLEWACTRGADLAVYGKADAGAIWPEVLVCSRTFQQPLFKNSDVRIGLEDARSFLQQTQSNAFPFTENDLKSCMIDTLVPARVDYLAFIALGIAFRHVHIAGLSAKQLRLLSNICFHKAVNLEKGNSDCRLNYCEALYQLAVTTWFYAKYDSPPDSIASLFDDANEAFDIVTEIKDSFPQAWYMWGRVLADFADLRSDDSAGTYYQDSFRKFEKATHTLVHNPDAFAQWGTAHVRYAMRNKGEVARTNYQAAFAKFDTALQQNPTDFGAYINWGAALSEYANQLPKNIAEKYYFESMGKLANADALSPSNALVFYNWGLVEQNYARRSDTNYAASYLKESIKKLDSAILLNPNYSDAYGALGISLTLYAGNLRGSGALNYLRQSFANFAKALESKPNDCRILYHWGQSTLLYYFMQPNSAGSEMRALWKDLDDATSKCKDITLCYNKLNQMIRIAASEDSTLSRYISQ